MTISTINSISFKALPPRRYPYVLPLNVIGGQEEDQMPKVREDIKAKEHNIDKEKALLALQSALVQAKPHLDKATRQQTAVLNATQTALTEAQRENKKLEHLMACSAQSAFQQDKHDAIWLFNRLSTTSKFNRDTAIYTLASAFKNLDREFDKKEIASAEKTLKQIYKKQPLCVRCDISAMYGNGKYLDFNS